MTNNQGHTHTAVHLTYLSKPSPAEEILITAHSMGLSGPFSHESIATLIVSRYLSILSSYCSDRLASYIIGAGLGSLVKIMAKLKRIGYIPSLPPLYTVAHTCVGKKSLHGYLSIQDDR